MFSRDDSTHEALLYAPRLRAAQPSAQAFLWRASPPVAALAMLRVLKENYALGAKFTLGVSGGLALERLAKPKYWVKSHDARLKYQGAVFWLLGVKDIFQSLDSGLEEESKTRPKGESRDLKRPNFVEIENCGCFLLE